MIKSVKFINDDIIIVNIDSKCLIFIKTIYDKHDIWQILIHKCFRTVYKSLFDFIIWQTMIPVKPE